MDLNELSQEVSAQIAFRAGLHIKVEMHGRTATLRGAVPSAEARSALLHLAAELMPRWELQDELQVEQMDAGGHLRAGEWLRLDEVG